MSKEKIGTLGKKLADLEAELAAYRWMPGTPENSKRVMVYYRNTTGMLRTTVAEYIKYRSILAEDYLSDDCDEEFYASEYDEGKDVYWTPAGWYESTYHGEMNMYITEKVLGWMPIPPLPKETE
jgi:hypothetical protein